jgi:type I restriction enzyme M protein
MMDQSTQSKIASFIWGIADAWIKRNTTRIGYEVRFTRHYYKPQPLRTLAEILATKGEAENVLDGPFKGISR